MFKCEACGRKFRSVSSAKRAELTGCPKCPQAKFVSYRERYKTTSSVNKVDTNK